MIRKIVLVTLGAFLIPYLIANFAYLWVGIEEASTERQVYKTGCYSSYQPRYISLYPTYKLGCWLGEPVFKE